MQQRGGQVAAHSLPERKRARGLAEHSVQAEKGGKPLALRAVVLRASDRRSWPAGRSCPRPAGPATGASAGRTPARCAGPGPGLLPGNQAADMRGAAGWAQQAAQHPQRRGFPGAVRADEGDLVSSVDGERKIRDGGHGVDDGLGEEASPPWERPAARNETPRETVDCDNGLGRLGACLDRVFLERVLLDRVLAGERRSKLNGRSGAGFAERRQSGGVVQGVRLRASGWSNAQSDSGDSLGDARPPNQRIDRREQLILNQCEYCR